MKVILKENIKSIGKKDEIVNVSDGYARNYLFAKKLAVEANNENLSKLKAKKDSENYKKDIEKQEAINTVIVNIGIKAKTKKKATFPGRTLISILLNAFHTFFI